LGNGAQWRLFTIFRSSSEGRLTTTTNPNNNPIRRETIRERIAFQTNVPVTVALAYADGLQVEGWFGDQIMYTLADERVMYVPPVVRTKLVGIQPREPFIICKAERKEGNRRFIEWQMNKEGNSDDLPPSETPPVNGQANGPDTPKPSNGQSSGVSRLQQALASSIDAAIAAEQCAITKGFSLRFGSEDLRATDRGCPARLAGSTVCRTESGAELEYLWIRPVSMPGSSAISGLRRPKSVLWITWQAVRTCSVYLRAGHGGGCREAGKRQVHAGSDDLLRGFKE
jgi:hypothetical protein